MPGGDKTGPMGMGPMTGRGAGYCAGYAVPGYMNPVPGGGQGFGWGRGRGGRGLGRGWGRWFAPPYVAGPMKEQELGLLRSQAESLKQALDDIRERMSMLEEDK